jgi:dipeptidyl aminopeptidase/acylaminoacyl peptidase
MISRLFYAVMLVCAALLAPLAAQGQAAAPDPKVPSAADFGALPFFTDPILAPGGTRIAARGLVDGKQRVVIIDIAGGARKISLLALPDKNQIQWLRWAGNDRVLVSLRHSELLSSVPIPVTRVYAIDLRTSKLMLLGPSQQGLSGDNLVFVDRAGKFALLATQASIFDYPTVYRIDLETGANTVVVNQHNAVWNWFADSSGVIRAGVGNSDTHWWLLYRSDGNSDFKRVINQPITSEDQGIQQFSVVTGSDQGYVIDDGKDGHFALYRYDFTGKQPRELLYENPRVDLDSFTTGANGELLNALYSEDRPGIVWFDADLKQVQAKLDRALPGAANRVISISDDKKILLVWSGSATDPGTYYVFDRTANRLDLLAGTVDQLVGKRMSSMEPVHYAARDGLDIPAYLTLPAGRGGTGLPLVIMPHGGPFARDEWDYEPWVQYLASRGYAVLQPNFRGSTGFGRAYVERGNGQWGRGMQDDIDDGVKWLAARGTVDPKRVCIMGASFGGYAAMWAAARNPELYRCAISFAGISDVAAMLQYDHSAFVAARYFRDWRTRVQGDRSFELDQVSPIKAVDRMTVPILIAHGADDSNVPVIQSKRLHDALTRLGRPHEYVVYPGEGHGFQDPAHATDFLNRVGAFLDKYNPAN